MPFVTLVPHAHIEDESRDESTFHGANKEADGKESGKILGHACEGGNDTPTEGEGG